MKRQKHEGGVKARVAAREAAVYVALAGLKRSTKEIEAKEAEEARGATVEEIATKLRFEYSGRTIREINTFNRSLKSKDKGKVRLAVATHLFGKYKVPGYMQECWYSDTVTKRAARNGGDWYARRAWEPAQAVINTSPEIMMRRDWYITQASGGSLYKAHAKDILTKGEVHAFLNCPIPCDFREAIIYALTTQWTTNVGVASRVMKSKLNTLAGVNWIKDRTMWREVIHFFCVNELTFREMNDLFDYFVHADAQANGRQQQYSLKGRNLQSLKRQMQDWHYELARVKKMGDAKWEGIPIADAEFELDGQPGNKWFFNQVKTSKELAAEGTAMHHCVYGYQSYCISGKSSIWSVKRLQRKKFITPERALTLEIDENGCIIQIRGFANRPSRPEELEAVRHWARKNYLTVSGSKWL
jgi:PcfJ-like protein